MLALLRKDDAMVKAHDRRCSGYTVDDGDWGQMRIHSL